MRPLIIICAFTLLFVVACAPARFVKPLEKKQQAVSLALGGPLISYSNAIIPIPFMTATYGYGIDSTMTGFASMNVTSGLFGNFHMDLGVTKQVLKQNRYIPAVSVTPLVNIIYKNQTAKKLYPQLAINAFWEYGKKKNLVYVGIDNWFELAQKRQYDIKQNNHWFFMPMIGHSFTTKKWNFNLEARFIAPNLSNEKLVVEYKTPLGTHGAFGAYFGVTRRF